MALAATALVLAGCSDAKVGDDFPDLSEVTPEDFPVGATIELTPTGCQPASATVGSGEIVRFVARAEVARAQAADGDIDTGEMYDGEETAVRRDKAVTVEVRCSAGNGAGPVPERNRARLRWLAPAES